MPGTPPASAPGSSAPTTSSARVWPRVVVGAMLVLGFVVVYTHFHDSRRLLDTRVLATCSGTPAATGSPVSADLDTSWCTGPVDSRVAARGEGWSVVTFVLPDSLGLDPRVGAVYVDQGARTVTLDYDVPVDESRRDAAGTATSTLVFVEVETDKLPEVPFTVDGDTGPVTVTAVPGA